MNEKGQLKCAALLLFGKDPLKYFTHAYFKIGRFGDSDHDLKFQDVIEGNIFEMIDKVIEILLSKYLTSPIHYEGMLRKEVLEYPEPALREAILNSIVHNTEEYLRKAGLIDREIKAVLYTKNHGYITNAIYQQINDLKQTVSSLDLQELVKKGLLVMSGNKGRGARYLLKK